MTEVLIILGLILLNGVLSMSEIALISARKTRLEVDAKKGSKSAKKALFLSADPDRFLSTIQIGITLIGILTGLYSGEAFAGDFAKVISRVNILTPYSFVIAKTVIVIVVTYLTLVLGELVPKRLGMSRAENISKRIASPMHVLSKIMTPFVWLLAKSTSFMVRVLGIKEDEDSKITEEEIKAIVKEGFDVGEVQEVEHDIVERVFYLGDRDVESIMTHRRDLVWLDINATKQEINEAVTNQMHEIYPVSKGNLNEMIGAVNLKDLFSRINEDDFSIEKIIRPANYLTENQSVYGALEQFKRANVKYGFVVDEFGDVQGIVTLKDIMKALVGEVDELSEEKEIFERKDGSLLVDGQCLFYNFLEFVDMQHLYADHEYNTLSGLILKKLDRIPHTGDKLTWHGLEFEIVDMDGARIDKILVTKASPKIKENKKTKESKEKEKK